MAVASTRANLPRLGISAALCEIFICFLFFVLGYNQPWVLWLIGILHVVAGFDFGIFSLWRNGFSLLIGMMRSELAGWKLRLLNIVGSLLWITCWPILLLTFIGRIAEYIAVVPMHLIIFFKKN